MTTEEALLAAVLAAPDDDLPRLVFADWLDENRRPQQAEYIRVEVNHAKIDRELLCHQPDAQMGDWCNDSLCPKCGQQVTPTYLPHSPEDLFVSDAERAILDRAESVVWERGFVSEIHCTLAEWCGCQQCGGVAPRQVTGGPVRITFGGGGTATATNLTVSCGACRGRGQAIGPQIVRRHPVERVVLTDVVGESAVQGSPFGAVTRESAGPLFDVAFKKAITSRVEGHAEELVTIMSVAAIDWAKSQPTHATGTTVGMMSSHP